MKTVAKAPTLTPDEFGRLSDLEAVVEAGQQTFVAVGDALAEIRDSRLYRDGFPTFDEYLAERWGWGRAYACRLIKAADAVRGLPAELLPIVNSEGAARAVASVPPESRAEVLAAVRDSGKPATAAQITLSAAELGKIHPKKTPAPQPVPTPVAPVNPPEIPESSGDQEPEATGPVLPPAPPEDYSDPFSELVYWWGQSSQDVRNRFCHHARLTYGLAKPISPKA